MRTVIVGVCILLCVLGVDAVGDSAQVVDATDRASAKTLSLGNEAATSAADAVDLINLLEPKDTIVEDLAANLSADKASLPMASHLEEQTQEEPAPEKQQALVTIPIVLLLLGVASGVFIFFRRLVM